MRSINLWSLMLEAESEKRDMPSRHRAAEVINAAQAGAVLNQQEITLTVDEAGWHIEIHGTSYRPFVTFHLNRSGEVVMERVVEHRGITDVRRVSF